MQGNFAQNLISVVTGVISKVNYLAEATGAAVAPVIAAAADIILGDFCNYKQILPPVDLFLLATRQSDKIQMFYCIGKAVGQYFMLLQLLIL